MLAALQGQGVPAGKPMEVKPEKKYFLIVCEGRRTEPLYFTHIQKFLPNDLLQTIEVLGQGDNTVNIVRKGIKKRRERAENPLVPNYDEVWAVFDKDDFPMHKYDTAVQLAMEQGIEHGVSNQSFELWYILHFELLESALHRKDYIPRLTNYLGFKYKKNDAMVVTTLFAKGNVRQAIKWAKRLEKVHAGKTPSESCPYTRVHILVERLLAYAKFPS